MPALPAHVVTLASGLTVAFEHRTGPGFAFDLRLPHGSIHDPPGQEGSASVLEEWLYKGAGERTARQFQDALDDLGVRRSGGCGNEATRLAASGLLSDLPQALSLYTDLIRRPHLSAEEIPVLVDLARQDLESYQDSPTDRLGLLVRAQTFAGSGYAHPTSGTLAGLGGLTAASVRQLFDTYSAAGSVLAVVADAQAEQVLAWAEALFGDWSGPDGAAPSAAARLSCPAVHLGLRHFLPLESQQTHFTLLGRGITPTSPQWYAWQLALTALSGGSASRLFYAVREERGLAYSVSAGSQLAGRQSLFTAYAGSTPTRAQETLDVMVSELRRWKQRGLHAGEFARAQQSLMASTVFGAESIRARSAALTSDLALFDEVRPPQHTRQQIEALTLSQVNEFLAGYEFGPLSLFVAGPAPLSLEGCL